MANKRNNRSRQGQSQAQRDRPGATSSTRAAAATRDTNSSDAPKSAAGRLFDLRWLIAGMFVVYGVVLIVVGAFDNQKEIDKAAGVRINLWAGIGMLILGLVFAAWARWKPLRRE